MQTLSHPDGSSQKPGRSFAAVALAGSLHLIVIYVVLAALNVVPMPPTVPPTFMHVIDKTVPPKTQALPPVPMTMVTPKTTSEVPAPKIPVDSNSGGPAIAATSDGGGVAPMMPDAFVAASAIPATHTIPSYPALDQRLNHEGAVVLTVVIDALGNVSDASVLKSSGYDTLDAAAVSWVKEHWRYKPAMRNGNAVATTARAEVTFRLTQK